MNRLRYTWNLNDHSHASELVRTGHAGQAISLDHLNASPVLAAVLAGLGARAGEGTESARHI